MPRYAYVNGRYVPHGRAMVHIEDRGFQFADGVYEVVGVRDGQFLDEHGHYDRLQRSLKELEIEMPMSVRAMQLVSRELIRRNGMKNGLLYIQVTRGEAKRDFPFPDGVEPTIVMTARQADVDQRAKRARGIKAITVPDIRWKRRDIKSVALLPQALAKQKAYEAGAGEAWQVDDDGYITEGSSSNAWIVTSDGTLVTRKATHDILKGVTRTTLISICEEEGLSFEERSFTPEEAYKAKEAFITSATNFAMAVVDIDGHQIGDGRPGTVSTKLSQAYMDYGAGQRKTPATRWTP